MHAANFESFVTRPSSSPHRSRVALAFGIATAVVALASAREAHAAPLGGAVLAAPPPAPAAAKPTAAATPATTGPTAAAAPAHLGASIDAATPQQKAAAGEAFALGMGAFSRGDFNGALARFRGSHGIVASPNSRIMIARSLAKLGRNEEAYREAQLTEAEASAAAAKTPKYLDTAKGARDDVAELAKSLAFVTILAEGAPDDAQVELGGHVIPREQWGKPILVAGGPVEAVLRSSSGEARANAAAERGKTQELRLAIALPAGDDEGGIDRARGAQDAPYSGPDRRTMGYVAAGVGGVGMVLFATFGALSNGKLAELEEGCANRLSCDPSLIDVAGSGRAYQTTANTSLAVGLVGLAAGAGLIAWDALDGGSWPWDDEKKDAPPAPVALSIGPGSLLVVGSF